MLLGVATAACGHPFPETFETDRAVYSQYVDEEDVEVDKECIWIDGCFDFSHHGPVDRAKARLTIKGKVKPDYKRSKVKVQIKKGKKYKKFKTVKTDKKSKFQVRLPAARRGKKLYFKITVPGNDKFLAYSEVWYTYSYKAPLARAVAKRS